MDMDRARELHRRGREAFDTEDWTTAGPALAELASIDDRPATAAIHWFDAALAAKFALDWPNAVGWGREAAALTERGMQDPVFWNLGIAATITGDWPLARDAWAGFGLTLPAGRGPIVGDLGRACVRLRTAEMPEVVWVERLCPARGRVINVPFDPARRLGDVVVHDGVPNGHRYLGDDRTVPVFDELVLLERSDNPTVPVAVDGDTADLDALDDLFFEHGGAFEVDGSARVTCRHCSEGTLSTPGHEHHAGRHHARVAARPDLVETLLEQWRTARPDSRSWIRR